MGRKLKFVLSDLHLGAGYAEEGGNPLEDFTAAREFIAFLEMIWQESYRDEREIELIINGDFLEFLQVPAVDDYDPTIAYPTKVYLDSSQEASIKRLNIIADGHQEVFSALSDFLHIGAPRRHITIIKGNHDVGLFWPGVKNRLREVLGASGARASLLRFADEFVSREKIYVEHGHQRTEKMNGYRDSFDPRSPDDPTQLYYPTGSRFVIDFFNQAERDQQFVDKIKPLTTLIWYALKWDFDFAGKALASFIRHTPTLEMNGSGVSLELVSSASSILQDLEDEGKRKALSERYYRDPEFRQQFHQEIGQYLDDANADNNGGPDLPQPKIGSDPITIGRANQARQRAMLRQAAETVTNPGRIKVILFGHTHEPGQELLSNGNLYINTGSWVIDFSQVSIETWEALFNGAFQGKSPPCPFPYARIDYDEQDNPQAQLQYFNQDGRQVRPAPTEPAPQTRLDIQSFFERNFDWLNRMLRPSSS